MSKVLRAVFTTGNDVDLTLDCGHEDFINISASSPVPDTKAMEGTEHECQKCEKSE